MAGEDTRRSRQAAENDELHAPQEPPDWARRGRQSRAGAHSQWTSLMESIMPENIDPGTAPDQHDSGGTSHADFSSASLVLCPTSRRSAIQ